MSQDPVAKRELLSNRIRGGLRLWDEVRLLADLASLINQAENLTPAVEALRTEPRTHSDSRPSRRDEKAWQSQLGKLQAKARVANILTARLRRQQLARLIFLRRAHYGFVLHLLSRSQSMSYADLQRDHLGLAERVASRYRQDIAISTPLELEYLRYRARNSAAAVETPPTDVADIHSVDNLLETPALNEVDVFVDLIQLIDLAVQFAKVLRQGRLNIQVMTTNAGHQPPTHAAKLVERLCRHWQRTTLPDLLTEIIALNLQASVLAAGEYEEVEIFTGSWQSEVWPGWIQLALEREWEPTKQFVKDVLELHELNAG